ncbi:Penicillin amidase OS=Streptomyces griseomycini OX=66895 GN=FHS37_001843 PE=3 SV=1 [Streptomyces griseomycini]
MEALGRGWSWHRAARHTSNRSSRWRAGNRSRSRSSRPTAARSSSAAPRASTTACPRPANPRSPSPCATRPCVTGDLGFSALLPLLRARRAADVDRAVDRWAEPVNVVMAADTEGGTLHRVAGRVPVRSLRPT